MRTSTKIQTAAAAATSIEKLNAKCFRQDIVLVVCKNDSEHQVVLALAERALRNGHIHQITDYRKSRCLDILIEFRRPPFLMTEVSLQNE